MFMHIVLVLCLSIDVVYPQSSCSNWDAGIDRPGAWYAHIQTMTSIEACCGLCQAEGDRCQSWVLVRVGTTTPSGCYLKQNIPPIDSSSACGQWCTSGYKQTSAPTTGRCAFPGGVFELGVDRPGSNYARLISPQNHPACCTICQAEGDKCRAWTFVRSGAPGRESGCFLKNQVPPPSNSPCVACTSGIK